MKTFFTILAVACSAATFAQIDVPQPSPAAKVEQTVGLSEVHVEYSRPAMRGRTIFGDLVPFNEMWRTGANASTKVEFTDDVTIMGKTLEAGKYALYTMPKKNADWTVMFYTNTSYWGTPGDNFKQEEVALEISVPAKSMKQTVESFTIEVEDISMNGAELAIKWENTKVEIPFSVDVDSKVEAQIEAFVNPEPNYRPYYNAASYYLEKNKELDKAVTWVDKALEIQPEAYWVHHLKAKILAKKGDKKGAKKAALMSIEKAKAAKNMGYVSMNEKFIESL